MKKQNDFYKALGILFLGIAFIAIGASILYINIKYKKEYNLIFLYALFFMLGLVAIIGGIFSFSKKEKNIKGIRKTCQVISCKSDRNSPSFYYLEIEYTGESGNTYKKDIPCTLNDITNFKPGTLLECYIDGEDFYIDSDNLQEINKL